MWWEAKKDGFPRKFRTLVSWIGGEGEDAGKVKLINALFKVTKCPAHCWTPLSVLRPPLSWYWALFDTLATPDFLQCFSLDSRPCPPPPVCVLHWLLLGWPFFLSLTVSVTTQAETIAVFCLNRKNIVQRIVLVYCVVYTSKRWLEKDWKWTLGTKNSQMQKPHPTNIRSCGC